MFEKRNGMASLAASFALACGLAMGVSDQAMAQTCGGTYRVQPGDTLSQIADKLYDDAGKWSAVFQSNAARIGERPDRITVGMRLTMPCIDGLPSGLKDGRKVVEKPAEVAPARLVVPAGNAANKRKINIVTGDDRKPFSGRDMPNGGMMTELVDAAMTAADPDGGYAIHWVNDWSAHFEPLMSNALLDAGFPWYRPDCENQPDTYRCQNLMFSKPVFEVLVLLFVHKDAQFAFNTDADIAGKTLCRPKGFATFFLDKDGRNWLKDGKVSLKTPITSDECFQMLARGDVDAVIMNEFHGREAVSKLNLKDQITIAGGKPLAIQGLHVVVHKSHPDAQQILDTVADGIDKIVADGSHQKIVEAHLSRIWDSF